MLQRVEATPEARDEPNTDASPPPPIQPEPRPDWPAGGCDAKEREEEDLPRRRPMKLPRPLVGVGVSEFMLTSIETASSCERAPAGVDVSRMRDEGVS